MTAAEAARIIEDLALSAAIAKLVDEAPPLSDGQRERLRHALDLPTQPMEMAAP